MNDRPGWTSSSRFARIVSQLQWRVSQPGVAVDGGTTVDAQVSTFPIERTVDPVAGKGRRRQAERLGAEQRQAGAQDHTTLPLTHTAPRRVWPHTYRIRLIIADVIVALLASSVASLLGPHAGSRLTYALGLLIVPLIWPVAVALTHGYQQRYIGVTVDEYRSVGRALVAIVAFLAALALILNVSLSRWYLVFLLVTLYGGGLIARALLRRWLIGQRRSGRLLQRTLVIGRHDAASDLVHFLSEHPEQGLLPVAVCTSRPLTDEHQASSIGGVAILGPSSSALDAANLCDAEVVIVSSEPEMTGKSLRRLAWSLEDQGIELMVSTGLLDVAGPRLSIRPAEDTSLLHVERPAANRLHMVYKDLMDRSMAFALLIVLSPLLLSIAAAVKLTSRGPALFRQTRIGTAGVPFTIFKFRTMAVGADRQLDVLRHLSDGNAVQFKMKRDPRVTRVGSFLRRYSLDELPQLLNVLLGDMSLVGPRPQSQQEVDQYESDTMRRLKVRPGMTGLWQVSGRSDLDWEESARLDLRYVDNWSPMYDLHILLRTVRAVFTGSGAY